MTEDNKHDLMANRFASSAVVSCRLLGKDAQAVREAARAAGQNTNVWLETAIRRELALAFAQELVGEAQQVDLADECQPRETTKEEKYG
jgi:hypothetical protein